MQQIAKRNNGDTETLLNFCGRKWKGLQFTRGGSLKLLKSELRVFHFQKNHNFTYMYGIALANQEVNNRKKMARRKKQVGSKGSLAPALECGSWGQSANVTMGGWAVGSLAWCPVPGSRLTSAGGDQWPVSPLLQMRLNPQQRLGARTRSPPPPDLPSLLCVAVRTRQPPSEDSTAAVTLFCEIIRWPLKYILA